MTVKRNKTRPLAVYIDSKYNDKIDYIKHTTGITKFVETCLDNFHMDPQVMRMLQRIKNIKP